MTLHGKAWRGTGRGPGVVGLCADICCWRSGADADADADADDADVSFCRLRLAKTLNTGRLCHGKQEAGGG